MAVEQLFWTMLWKVSENRTCVIKGFLPWVTSPQFQGPEMFCLCVGSAHLGAYLKASLNVWMLPDMTA